MALLGARAGAAAQDLATAGVGEVLTVIDAALEPYTPDGYVLALAHVIASASPQVIALAHTYQARDFAPMLAARLTLPLITDVTGVTGSGLRRASRVPCRASCSRGEAEGFRPYLVTSNWRLRRTRSRGKSPNW